MNRFGYDSTPSCHKTKVEKNHRANDITLNSITKAQILILLACGALKSDVLGR